MLCSNCFNAEYETRAISRDMVINNQKVTIPNIECEICPKCNDIVFTHKQSLELDKMRINYEFSSKPLLTSYQLRLLRHVLELTLEEICDLLHIGKNTYGRWERGEIEITPSMNLLVHNLIDKFPIASANLIDAELRANIERAKHYYLTDSISLGELIRNAMKATKILPEVLSNKLGLGIGQLSRLENNELDPKDLPPKVYTNILEVFYLTEDNLRQILLNTLRVRDMKTKVSFVHTRKASYTPHTESRSINKILEKYVTKRNLSRGHSTSTEYIEKVNGYLKGLHVSRGRSV
jgi:putative zinc finger/helix-turn-helix YgiT family protein